MHIDTSFIRSRDREPVREFMSRDRFTDEKLSAPVYEDATVIPGQSCLDFSGVVDSEGKYLRSSSFSGVYTESPELPEQEYESIGNAIFIGNFYPGWGHCITDSLSKIWFLYTEEAQGLVKEGYKIIYLGFDNRPAPKYARELFELAGAGFDTWIHITRTTSCKRLVLPDSSFQMDANGFRHFTKEYRQIINRIKKSVPPITTSSASGIYLSRRGCNNLSRDYGEQRIINAFQSCGFSTICPEQLSVREQIGMYKGCRCLAATEGSISHNTVFCEPGTKCIILRKVNHCNSYTATINQCADLDVTFIDVHHSNHVKFYDKLWIGPFYLCITGYLERYLKIRISHPHRWFDKEWYQYVSENPFAPYRDFLFKAFRRIKKMTNLYYSQKE